MILILTLLGIPDTCSNSMIKNVIVITGVVNSLRIDLMILSYKILSVY